MGVILSLFWPYRAIFWVGVGSKKFLGGLIITTFLFISILYCHWKVLLRMVVVGRLGLGLSLAKLQYLIHYRVYIKLHKKVRSGGLGHWGHRPQY